MEMKPLSEEEKEASYQRMLKKIRIALMVLVPLALLSGLLMKSKGYFIIDEWRIFYAFYSLFACVVIILISKLLGFILKRKEGYYDK